MIEPILASDARADLREIWYEIARGRDEATADRMTASILARCREHARFPETGRSREEWGPGVRSFPVRPYVVVYRPIPESIQVLRIFHGRRDLDRLMKDERPTDP